MMMHALRLWTLVVLLLSAPAVRAAPDEDVEGFARVIVAETELRRGPGVSHGVVHLARRGDSFAVQGREGTGFWLRVYLPDGRTAYILGDTVEPVALDPDSDEASGRPGVFSPPALDLKSGGFALLAGVFDGSGYAEVKPALLLGPSLAIEPYAGLALGSEGRRFTYGGSVMLNFAPEWVVAPYLLLGGGAITTFPNDDSFLLKKGTAYQTRAGGGLLASFRWRLLVRLEATNTAIFDADSYINTQSYVGGLGTYF